MVGILAQALGGGGMVRTRARRLVFPTAGELDRPTLSRGVAQPGEVVRITTGALDASGFFMSPFGDPTFLEFVRASPHPSTGKGRCLTSDFETIWAEYRVKDDVRSGTARMALALFENVSGGCNGDGARRDEVEAFLRVEAPEEPTPAPAPTPPPAEEPAPTPPPEEEPVPLVCKIPILKQFFCPQ